MYRIVDRAWQSRTGMLRLLERMAESSDVTATDYLTAEAARDLTSGPALGRPSPLAVAAREVGEAQSGLAVFWRGSSATVVIPPIPLEVEAHGEGLEAGPLTSLLDIDLCLGIVLLLLGNYAVGVVEGNRLVASKSGSRYVKSRHRTGGSSAGRFARSRERLVREIFDKCCEVSRAVLGPHEAEIDHLLLGGERHTLVAFQKRCEYLKRFAGRTSDRVLAVERPGRRALEGIGGELWKSRVILLEPTPEEPPDEYADN